MVIDKNDSEISSREDFHYMGKVGSVSAIIEEIENLKSTDPGALLYDFMIKNKGKLPEDNLSTLTQLVGYLDGKYSDPKKAKEYAMSVLKKHPDEPSGVKNVVDEKIDYRVDAKGYERLVKAGKVNKKDGKVVERTAFGRPSVYELKGLSENDVKSYNDLLTTAGYNKSILTVVESKKQGKVPPDKGSGKGGVPKKKPSDVPKKKPSGKEPGKTYSGEEPRDAYSEKEDSGLIVEPYYLKGLSGLEKDSYDYKRIKMLFERDVIRARIRKGSRPSQDEYTKLKKEQWELALSIYGKGHDANSSGGQESLETPAKDSHKKSEVKKGDEGDEEFSDVQKAFG